jgi:hypothetical protein
MDILQRLSDVILKLTGRSRIKKSIKEMRDYPACLTCKKETKKIMEDKWCFQCYYEKSDMDH